MSAAALRAGLLILGLAAAVAYLPGTFDATTTLRWAVVAVGVFLLLCLVRPAPFPWGAALCVALAGASVLWSSDPFGGLDHLAKLVAVAGAFWLGGSLDDATPLWKGIALGVAASAVIAIAQVVVGLDWFVQAAPPAGLFGNRNFLAEAGMVALITSLATVWTPGGAVLAALAGVAILLTGSKAVIGALVILLAVYVAPQRPAIAWGLAGMVVLVAGLMFGGGAGSAAARLEIWQPAWSGLSWFGNGLGSFAYDFSPVHEHAHSEPLQYAYELGVLAIAPAALLIHVLGGWEHDREGFVLVGVALVGFLAFPFHMPVTALAAGVAAGRLARKRSRMGGHDRPRGLEDGGRA